MKPEIWSLVHVAEDHSPGVDCFASPRAGASSSTALPSSVWICIAAPVAFAAAQVAVRRRRKSTSSTVPGWAAFSIPA